MIFADKLILHRKKAGWSQEELAEKMNVSRQSVSKWEGAQSVPDLQKIIRLSELFDVSTDYLLKDEIEDIEFLGSIENSDSLRRVTMEEANSFLAVKATTSRAIAFATFLCILSPISLFLLAVISESGQFGVSENAAAGIGMIVLLVIIAAAVSIFIASGSKTAPYEYLETEIFETEYGVSGMVKERKEQYKAAYTRNNVLATCICIFSAVPIFAGVMFDEHNDLLIICLFSVTLLLIGIGTYIFVRTGIIWASYEKLLQEGDYSRSKKEKQSVTSAISLTYWLIAIAIYLGWSFSTDGWKSTWVVWVIAGVLYPAVLGIINVWLSKK